MPDADQPKSDLTTAEVVALAGEGGDNDDAAALRGETDADPKDETTADEPPAEAEKIEPGADEPDPDADEPPAEPEAKPEDEVADLSAIKLEDEEEKPAEDAKVDPTTIIEDEAEFKDVPASIDEAVGKFKPLKPDRVTNAINAINQAVELDELPGSLGKALAEALEEVQELVGSEQTRRQMVKRDLSRVTKQRTAAQTQRATELDRMVDTFGFDANLIGKHGARGEAQKAIVEKLTNKARALYAEAAKTGKKIPDEKALFLDAARRLNITTGAPAAPAKNEPPKKEWGKLTPGKNASPAPANARPQEETPRRQRLGGLDEMKAILGG